MLFKSKKSAGEYFHILGGKDLFFKQMKIYRLGELEDGGDSSHTAQKEDGWLEKHFWAHSSSEERVCLLI